MVHEYVETRYAYICVDVIYIVNNYLKEINSLLYVFI